MKPIKTSSKPIFWAIVSFIGFILFNFLLISLFSRSASFALEQMVRIKVYILFIALGFSIQVALFVKMKEAAYLVSGAGVISTGTMIACCVHHVTESLPFLVLGGLGAILINYQKELLLLSIAVNWLGVLYMVKKLRRLNGRKR